MTTRDGLLKAAEIAEEYRPGDPIARGIAYRIRQAAAELPEPVETGALVATEAQINHMVSRFLGWRLPEDFRPDAGISFKAEFNENTPWPMRHEPTGTNLFDADQAGAMVRYMVEGMPTAAVRIEALEAELKNACETGLIALKAAKERIEALEAENARLREALKRIADLVDTDVLDDAIDFARAALGSEKK